MGGSWAVLEVRVESAEVRLWQRWRRRWKVRHSRHLESKGTATPSRALFAAEILDSRPDIVVATGWAGPRVEPNMTESSCSVSMATVLPLGMGKSGGSKMSVP